MAALDASREEEDSIDPARLLTDTAPLAALSNSIPSPNAKPSVELLESYRTSVSVLEHFLERPRRLDSVLARVVSSLMRVVKVRAHMVFEQFVVEDHQGDAFSAFKRPSVFRHKILDETVFPLLYSLFKTRGWKKAIPYVPHEACDLEPCLALLQTSRGEWTATYVCLCWLWLLVVVPFPLSTLDESSNDSLEWRIASTLKIVARTEAGVNRRLACRALARLLSRSDCDLKRADLKFEASVEREVLAACLKLPGAADDLAESTVLAAVALADVESASETRTLSKCVSRGTVRCLLRKRTRAVGPAITWLTASLSHSDTDVRRSAAKGIARIVERMHIDQPNSTHPDRVVELVLRVFENDENRPGWHGACVTLAEIVRRRSIVLKPTTYVQVAREVRRACEYEHVRDRRSSGESVRDAACYVCWALGRSNVFSAVEIVMPSLVATACLDREVNCRRAASAAAQELLGRAGATSFPYGIELINLTDYYALSNRARCVSEIAPKCAALWPDFKSALVDRVLRNLEHWDESTRELCAKVFGELRPEDPIGIARRLLFDFSPPPTRMHGVLRLLTHNPSVAKTLITKSSTLLRAVRTEADAHHKGGELLRSAACRLVCALECYDDADATQFVIDHVTFPVHAVQDAACESLVGFAVPDEVVDSWIELISKEMYEPGDRQRGAAKALGVLKATKAVAALQARLSDDSPEFASINVCVLESLHEMKRTPPQYILDTALENYAVDKRGDVGSWVRRRALELFGEEELFKGALIRTSLEKLDSLRRIAFQQLGLERDADFEDSLSYAKKHGLMNEAMRGLASSTCSKDASVSVKAFETCSQLVEEEGSSVLDFLYSECFQQSSKRAGNAYALLGRLASTCAVFRAPRKDVPERLRRGLLLATVEIEIRLGKAFKLVEFLQDRRSHVRRKVAVKLYLHSLISDAVPEYVRNLLAVEDFGRSPASDALVQTLREGFLNGGNEAPRP